MADRSLAFFTTLANRQSNVDPKTGLSTTTHTVQYDIKKYDKTDPLSGDKTTSESKTVDYTLVQSLQADGQFINYQGNSNTNNYTAYTSNPEQESDIKLSSIIEWTKQNHPSMKLKAEHFTYLKDFGVYPANRMMVLRRFNDGVTHDLFNCTTPPISTMATYYNLEKSPFTMEFKEEWTDFEGSIMELLQDIVGIKFDQIPKVGKIIGAAMNAAPSNFQQTVIEAIGQKLGLVSTGGAIYGDPNIIYQAAIRDSSSDEVKSGLKSDIRITFDTHYMFREINGVDGKVAMLDIIANCIHMGTSNSRFILTHNGNDKLNQIVNAMQDGKVDGLLNVIIDSISDIVTESGKILSNIMAGAAKDVSALVQGNTKPLVDDIINGLNAQIRNRFSRYKWKLRGAIGAMTGQHTAPWHVTIGNPKFPWFTIGNLILDSIHLDFGGELSYNDMPTELNVKITLKSGRVMGAQELTELFNNGKGRIYDTPEKVQQLKMPSDQQVTFSDSPSADQSSNASNAPADTDRKNAIHNVTPFSMNNQDSDNNIPK